MLFHLIGYVLPFYCCLELSLNICCKYEHTNKHTRMQSSSQLNLWRNEAQCHNPVANLIRLRSHYD